MAADGKGGFKPCGPVLAMSDLLKPEKLVSNSSRPVWSPGLDRAPSPCRELELLSGCSPLCWCRGGTSQGLSVPQGTMQSQVVPEVDVFLVLFTFFGLRTCIPM